MQMFISQSLWVNICSEIIGLFSQFTGSHVWKFANWKAQQGKVCENCWVWTANLPKVEQKSVENQRVICCFSSGVCLWGKIFTLPKETYVHRLATINKRIIFSLLYLLHFFRNATLCVFLHLKFPIDKMISFINPWLITPHPLHIKRINAPYNVHPLNPFPYSLYH